MAIWFPAAVLLALSGHAQCQLVNKLYELTPVASSDGHSLGSKILRTKTVRNKVDCASWATYYQSHGFRMSDGDTTCSLMNLEYTKMDVGGSDQVYVDADIPLGNVSWTDWSASWSSCTKVCDGGTQTKTRSCPTAKFRGFQVCPGSSSKSQACNTDVCPRIKQISWETADESYGDMTDDDDDDTGISVAVVTHHYGHCWTTPLNNPKDNWNKGQIDVFDADDAADMGACWNWAVPGRAIRFVRVLHEGKDSWKGLWVDIHFTVGDKLRCTTDDGKRWYIFKGDEEDLYNCN